MAKLRSAAGSDSADSVNTVFVDTSLDTHLALIVSSSDTVSDLKKKILYEHHVCFPNVGEIEIHALKVKRRGLFYHLSDSMLVKSAFDELKKNWFLSVDASKLLEHSEEQCQLRHNPDFDNQLVCFGNRSNTSADGIHLLPDDPSKRLSKIGDSQLAQIESNQDVNQEASTVGLLDLDTVKHNSVNHCNASLPDLKKTLNSDIQNKYDLHSKEYELPGAQDNRKEDNSRNEATDMECNASPEALQTVLDAKKVLKRKHKRDTDNEDAVHGHTLKGVNASGHRYDKNKDPENSLGDAGREVSYNMKMGTEIVTDEPCRTASSDTSKRSSIGVQKTKELHVDTAVPGNCIDYKYEKTENRVVDVLCNNSLEEDSQYRHAAKKRKIETEHDNEGSLKENKDFACDSINETSTSPAITEYSLGEGQRSTNTNVDSISAKALEDDHSMRTNKRSGKKKKVPTATLR